MATMNGTIKRLTDKGFGFIAASDGSEYLLPPIRLQRHTLRRTARRPVRHLRARAGSEGPRAENVRVSDTRVSPGAPPTRGLT